MTQTVIKFRSEIEQEPIGIEVIVDVGVGYKVYIHEVKENGKFVGYEVLRMVLNYVQGDDEFPFRINIWTDGIHYGSYNEWKNSGVLRNIVFLVREYIGNYAGLKAFLKENYDIDFYIKEDGGDDNEV